MDSQSSLSTRALKEYQNIYLCPLTMEIMVEPYALPCQHTFQQNQIRKYLLTKQQCPLCRKKVKFQEGAINLLAKQGIQIYKKQLQRKQKKQEKQQAKQSIKQCFIINKFLLNNGFCLYLEKQTKFEQIIQKVIDHQKLPLSVNQFNSYFYTSKPIKGSNAEQIFIQLSKYFIQPKNPQWGDNITINITFVLRVPYYHQFFKLLQQRKYLKKAEKNQQIGVWQLQPNQSI